MNKKIESTITRKLGSKYVHLIPGDVEESATEGWMEQTLEVRITSGSMPTDCPDSSDEVVLSWEDQDREVYGSDQTEALDGETIACALANAVMGTDYATA